MQKGNIIHEAGEGVEVAQNRFKKPQELEQGSQCYQQSSFLPPLGLIFADSLQPHGRDDDNWQFQLPVAQVSCPRGKNVLLLESRLPVSKNSLIEHIWVLAHGPITVTSSKGTGICQFYMRCPSLQPREMNAMTDIPLRPQGRAESSQKKGLLLSRSRARPPPGPGWCALGSPLILSL